MKNTKKKVLVGALVLSLAAMISVGSIAWYSAKDSVENKFLVATSDQDPKDTFSVDVWEEDPKDPNNPEQSGFTYPDVMPGDTLDKKPHVENTGKYEQYIRLVITVTDADAWAGVLTTDPANPVAPADVKLTDIVTQFNDVGFKLDDTFTPVYNRTDKTLTYVYYGNGTLPAGAETWIFKDVKIPDNMTKEQAVAFSKRGNDKQTSFLINVKAQAVQTQNLDGGKATVYEQAKYAFETVGMAVTD
ncbi:MAG: hypothetical protein II735_01330 [Clostridia bacterium]|nr:hypothetical protein [Clostridia bacterium]